MGGAASILPPLVAAVVPVVGGFLQRLFSPPTRENQTVSHIQQRQRQEEEQQRIEQAIRDKEDALRRQRAENECILRQMREQAEQIERERQEERYQLQQEQERLLAEFKRREEEQKAAEEELKRHHREREELLQSHLKLLEKGISPKVWPTKEEWTRARQRLAPGEGKFHCAVAGISGSGKSSLINALRGLRNKGSQAAEIGVTETTQKITYYPDLSSAPPHNRFVWYDVPGAGTLTIPGPQYFNSQGLFVFDLIIVVLDTRFTTQDVAILQQCEYFKIPSFIVRSKANQHIDNIMHEELGYVTDDTDQEEDYKVTLENAKQILIKSTRASVRKNLEEGELNPSQRVYIVSADCIRGIVMLERQGKRIRKPDLIIDEAELIRDLVGAIAKRRYD
ncbi:interferon-inducible GTPase-domain-containing protein [Kalaharituber pfeilii]|nr:interferon-inducible GTPase-domain-containing protein [Kalaharituber pfeilii]